MKKDSFSSMFDNDKRIAAKRFAAILKSSGFKVLSSGYGVVVVLHDGKSIMINAVEKDVNEFIVTNSHK